VVLVTYGPTLYESLGFNNVQQLCLTAAYTTAGAVFCYVGTFLVDRVGRVRLTIIGMVGQIIVISIVTALVAKYAGTTNHVAQRATVAMFWVFSLFYCGIVEGPTWVYISEIWPVHLRAKGTAFGVMNLYLMDLVYLE
jgi:MFS family permease